MDWIWFTPGLVVNVPADGELTQARFVIFARGPDPGNNPENNLANIYGYPMTFHVWTDGVEGGADSFDKNPHGDAVPGHIYITVNQQFTTGFITVEPFGTTGPVSVPDMFTTFLVTIDLSSFNIALQGDTEYVMGIFQDNDSNFITGGGFFRISASRATGFEDVFQTNLDTGLPEYNPGYVDSQHEFGYEQLAGSFTLAPLLVGDYDFDGAVDGADFLKWQRSLGTNDSTADGDDSGLLDGADLVIWEDHFGEGAAAAANTAVPEPPGAILLIIGLAALRQCSRHTPCAVTVLE